MKQTIGEFLSTQRKAHGYTQEEAAEKLGVSNRTISSRETDRTVPDVTLLPAIADIYGVTVDEILRGERKASDEAAQASTISEKSYKALLKNKYEKCRSLYTLLTGGIIADLFLLIFSFFCMVFLSNIAGIICSAIAVLVLILLLAFSLYSERNALRAASSEDISVELRNQYILAVKHLRRRLTVNVLKLVFCCFVCILIAIFFMIGRMKISILCFFLPFVGLVCLSLELFLFYSNFFKEVFRYGTEEAIAAARFNRKLLKKTCLFACILPVIGLAAVVVPLFWKAPVQIILAEGNKQELATVTVKGYDVPSGVYTFDIEDLNTEAENAVVYYENGFYIEYYKTETGGKVDLMYSGDGEVFITCGIVLQPDGQTEILYLFPTNSYEDFQNDKRYEASEKDGVYTVYYREKVDVDITIGAIYILLAIDAASAAVGAIVYTVKRKKCDFSF